MVACQAPRAPLRRPQGTAESGLLLLESRAAAGGGGGAVPPLPSPQQTQAGEGAGPANSWQLLYSKKHLDQVPLPVLAAPPQRRPTAAPGASCVCAWRALPDPECGLLLLCLTVICKVPWQCTHMHFILLRGCAPSHAAAGTVLTPQPGADPRLTRLTQQLIACGSQAELEAALESAALDAAAARRLLTYLDRQGAAGVAVAVFRAMRRQRRLGPGAAAGRPPAWPPPPLL